MSYFDGIRIGDKIWTIQEGWTKVIRIGAEVEYTIHTTRDLYTVDGKYKYNDSHQSAFWSDPQIVAPPRPKRYKKVKVEVRPYLNKNENKIWLWGDLNRENNPYGEWIGPVQLVEIEVDE